jgi:hypothetical protein
MTQEDIVRTLTETESRSKSNTKRLDKVEERQDALDRLITTVEVLATREENVEKDVKEIKSDVKSLTSKPGKRWEGLVDKALAAIVGGFVAWILAGSPGV